MLCNSLLPGKFFVWVAGAVVILQLTGSGARGAECTALEYAGACDTAGVGKKVYVKTSCPRPVTVSVEVCASTPGPDACRVRSARVVPGEDAYQGCTAVSPASGTGAAVSYRYRITSEE
jgi:hypothetical protein